ncbi:MAG: NTP transferase domain-containing protein [Armatimonadota bacterium]
MKAIVLAAGIGRRMWPLGETRNKTTLPVGNVPNVRRVVDDIRGAGIREIVVAVGHLEASVRHALRGVPELTLVAVDPVAGSAASASVCLRNIESDASVLVVPGDLATPSENLERLLAAHRDSDAAATVLTSMDPLEDPKETIGIEVRGGVVRAVVGCPRDPMPRWTGAVVLSPRTFDSVHDNPGIFRHVPVGGMPPMASDLGESLAQLIEDGASVAAVDANGYAIDLDKPWQVIEANERWVAHRLATAERDIVPESCRISDGADIKGRLLLGENVVIGKRCVIDGGLIAGAGTTLLNGPMVRGGVALGSGVAVRDYALLESGTVCGDRGVYGHGAEFQGTALDNVYLYHYCEIYGFLGSSVDIGAATVCGTLRFDDGEARHRVGGRIEVPRVHANASYIGDHSRTGVNAVLLPGSRVGAWSCVGPGVVHHGDLPSREAVFVKQELERKPWGPERYGW